MTELEETWSPEPVKAWRYWSVGPLEWDFGEHRWRVQIAGDVEVWESPIKFAGQHNAIEARMENGEVVYHEVDHRSPQQGCMCGINAVKAPDWNELRSRSSVHTCTGEGPDGCHDIVQVVALAPVELAGIVDEYDGGYRAEQATIIGPVHLFNGSPKLARVVSSIYGLEVIAEDWEGQWAQDLYRETLLRKVTDGHRKADTSDHRGTGTGQDTGTGKRTSKGWRKVGVVVLALAMATLVMFIQGTAGYVLFGDTNGQGEAFTFADRLLGGVLLVFALGQAIWGWTLIRNGWKLVSRGEV